MCSFTLSFAFFLLVGLCDLICSLIFSVLIKEYFELVPWHPLSFHDDWYYRLHQSLISKAFNLYLGDQSLNVLFFNEYNVLKLGLFE